MTTSTILSRHKPAIPYDYESWPETHYCMAKINKFSILAGCIYFESRCLLGNKEKKINENLRCHKRENLIPVKPDSFPACFFLPEIHENNSNQESSSISRIEGFHAYYKNLKTQNTRNSNETTNSAESLSL